MMLSRMLEAANVVHTPRYRMSNGREMPGLALGTFLGYDEHSISQSRIIALRNIVAKAIDMGYRHIDTSSVYNTEISVGEAIFMKISQKVVIRENLFITCKLWNTAHRREQVHDAIKETLRNTRLEYVDLYLMHWPIGLNVVYEGLAEPTDVVLPKNWNPITAPSSSCNCKFTLSALTIHTAPVTEALKNYSQSDVDYMETWQGMEEVQRLGLAKSIGVANFNMQQLQRLLSECTVKPVALLIEVHPLIIQQELIDFCKSKRIVVMAYCPLGSLVRRFDLRFPGPKIYDPFLMSLANKYQKTPAQIVLRWAVDRGVVPVTRSVNWMHLDENIDIFDFRLLPQEIEQINLSDANYRFICPSYWQDHPYYPFDKVQSPMADPFRA